MTNRQSQGTTQPDAKDDLQELSQQLLQAIEAEPVPEPILGLARRLAQALALREGAEAVPPLPPPAGAQDGK